MRKYSYLLTSALGIGAAVVLILYWDTIPMITRLPILYIIVLSVHEIEELKLPGGFVELVTGMTGVEIRNIGTAKFGLFLFTLYATVLPALLSSYVWPVMATMLIGIIEILAHLAAARVNKEQFYSPGLVTAAFVQFPVAAYGFWYLLSSGLVKGIYWPAAGAFLLIPLFGLQGLIVRSNGKSYREFMNNARKAMFSGKN